MIWHVFSSKVLLGDGDEISQIIIFCLTLKVIKFVPTQYKMFVINRFADAMFPC